MRRERAFADVRPTDTPGPSRSSSVRRSAAAICRNRAIGYGGCSGRRSAGEAASLERGRRQFLPTLDRVVSVAAMTLASGDPDRRFGSSPATLEIPLRGRTAVGRDKRTKRCCTERKRRHTTATARRTAPFRRPGIDRVVSQRDRRRSVSRRPRAAPRPRGRGRLVRRARARRHRRRTRRSRSPPRALARPSPVRRRRLPPRGSRRR